MHYRATRHDLERLQRRQMEADMRLDDLEQFIEAFKRLASERLDELERRIEELKGGLEELEQFKLEELDLLVEAMPEMGQRIGLLERTVNYYHPPQPPSMGLESSTEKRP